MSDLFNLYAEAGSPNGDDQPQSAIRWAADEIERLRGRCEEAEATVAEHRKVLESYEWMVLRKQAEAIDEVAEYFGGRDFADVRFIVSEHAQRLRQQAAESENGAVTRKAD